MTPTLDRTPPAVIEFFNSHANDVVILLNGKQIVPALPGDERGWTLVNSLHGFGHYHVKCERNTHSESGQFTIKWNAAYEAKLAKEDGAILYQAFKTAYAKKYGAVPAKYVHKPDHLIMGYCEVSLGVDISHKLPELYDSSAAARELIALAKADGLELHTFSNMDNNRATSFKVTRVEKNAPIFVKVMTMGLSYGFTAGAVEEVKSAYIGSKPIPTNHIERAMETAKAIDKAMAGVGMSAADVVNAFSNEARDATAKLEARDAEVERLRSLVKEQGDRIEFKEREIKSLNTICNRMAVSAKEKDDEIVALRGQNTRLIQTRGDLRVTLGRIIDLCDLGANTSVIRRTADGVLRGI